MSESVISKPSGGGAQQGLGEKFSPDLFTGTGNFSVPIGLPTGRNGFQPELSLSYSTGNGNSAFGYGWGISVPGVIRKLAKGVPKYDEHTDTFILSGAEDLINVAETNGRIQYRPRTEGLFARIYHHLDNENDYWEVLSKDGLKSYYGCPNAKEVDNATVKDPENPEKVFHWKLSKTEDTFGNIITYKYIDGSGENTHHKWSQNYISEISYLDYGDQSAPDFLVKVKFVYEERPDAFSEYKPGFELRVTKRCKKIEVYTCAGGIELLTRVYHFKYIDEDSTKLQPINGVSLLIAIEVEGIDGQSSEFLPPLNFNYSRFSPEKQKFTRIEGDRLPLSSLSNPSFEFVDLFGNGLPDLVEINGQIRYWKNLGGGKFDQPRIMQEAPTGVNLADPNVQIIDANGDGRADVMVSSPGLSGYFSTRFGASWDEKSFKKYDESPSFNLFDPEVKLVDLTGDGITDALKSSDAFECFFNDKDKGWINNRRIPRKQILGFPNVSFSDQRVKWADMCGDGLQDIVLVNSSNIAYWPSKGYGSFAPKVQMKNAPRLPQNFDPQRLLLGDVDGDGLADLIYVGYNKVSVWFNKSGNGWSEPIEVGGIPTVQNPQNIQLIDLYGNGTSGILFSIDSLNTQRPYAYFLDLTAGTKPYLLNEMDNNMGALTKVHYSPSTKFYLADQKLPETRWKTHLPFPVQVVEKVEVIDKISKGKLTTEYSYHHGYWDGGEREFRGFGRVDQRDTESFEKYQQQGLHGNEPFTSLPDFNYYTPAIESRNWFHLGPIGDEFGDWEEVDFSNEYWQEDKQVLPRDENTMKLLQSLHRRAKRDAYRTWRGSSLRTELYALDNNDISNNRPYTVTESQYGLRLEYAPKNDLGHFDNQPVQIDNSRFVVQTIPKETSGYIFFSFGTSSRTTQWERGNDPMTQLSFTGSYDSYGQPLKQLAIAVPRTRSLTFTEVNHSATEKFLATGGETKYIYKDNATQYMVTRSCRSTTYEIVNNGTPPVFELRDDFFTAALPVQSGHLTYSIISQSLQYYDGTEHGQGLPFGEIGTHGVATYSETLVFTDSILSQAYGANIPEYYKDTPDLSTGYPTNFSASLQTPLQGDAKNLGWIKKTNQTNCSDGYYAPSGTTKFDFQDSNIVQPRGLVLETKDPFGVTATIEYDQYDFLPIKSAQLKGGNELMVTSAQYDYRVFQANLITDPNGNRSAFAFTPLGMLHKSAVMGKTTENVGDDLDHPSVWLEYDFFAWKDQRQPVWVKTTQRTQHYYPTNTDSDTITAIEYSDGFGRLLQTRSLAEDIIFGDTTFGDSGLPADQDDPNQNAVGVERSPGSSYNVRVSGWTVYNNKGKAVEQYEPFFSTGFNYQPVLESQKGQKARLYYDPRGQVIKTLSPNGSISLTIFGRPDDPGEIPLDPNRLDKNDTRPYKYTPTPWEVYTYDANDLAKLTHNTESLPYSHHWNTPGSITVDALGRTIKATNRLSQTDTVDMTYEYDIRGNVLSITDAIGRVVFRNVYDLTNQALFINHLDAGDKYNITDCTGKPIEAWDEKGSRVLSNYDELGRPLKTYAEDYSGEGFTVRSYALYDDDTVTAPILNRLGMAYKTYDESGLATVNQIDFKGNPLSAEMQVVADSVLLVPINAGAGSGSISPYRMEWTEDPESQESALLETDVYATDTEYDALNRATQTTLPADINSNRKVMTPTYNRAGTVTSVDFDGTKYLNYVAFNAKGQPIITALNNGIMSRVAYDPLTFRVARMKAEKYTYSTSGNTHTMTYVAGTTRQDCAYEYDLVGNILKIKDRSPSSGIDNTLLGSDALDRLFSYDPLYRLLKATGRESGTNSSAYLWSDQAQHSVDGNGLPTTSNCRQYTRRYTYDKMGNITRLTHTANANNFTRAYKYISGTNRLNKITDGQGVPTTLSNFTFDANGNQTDTNTERHYEWNAGDNIRSFYLQTSPGASITKYAQYVYSGGNRVKKLVWTSSTNYESITYLGGFEYRKKINGGTTEEKNYTQIPGGVEIRTGSFTGDISETVLYQLADPLNSITLRLDANGTEIDREEYYPYGDSALHTFSKKRYRFTGKEKDEESGLYYYGARYYSPWTCQFTSVDPAAPKTSYQTPYNYADNNPIMMNDPTGMQSSSGNMNGGGSTTNQSNSGSKGDGESSETNKDNPSYEWSEGNQNTTSSNLEAGNYSVGVTDTPMFKPAERCVDPIGEVETHEVVSGETLTGIAAKYDKSVETLAKWNNISDVNKIYAGEDLIVSDPNRPMDRGEFETDPVYGGPFEKTQEGGKDNNVTSLSEMIDRSLSDFSEVNVTGELLDKVKSDPFTRDFILRKTIDVIIDDRYLNESFYLADEQVFELGGESGGIINKLKAAPNELTWTIRHATVKYWIEVSKSGDIEMSFRLDDVLDLKGEDGRPIAYNIISNTLGFFYHVTLGGNIHMQVKARWTYTVPQLNFKPEMYIPARDATRVGPY